MSVFWNLVYYEMKKSLMRKSTAVTVFLVLLISVVSIFGTILSGVYSENGKYIRSGYDDMKLDRKYAWELSGREIDTPLMMEAAKSYSHIDLNGYSRYTSTFEYTDGYQRFFSIMYTTGFLTAAAISIIFAPIFSGEYISGADSLILSSKHGRNLLIPAKLFVVAVSSVCFSVSLTAITYGICMLVSGADGAGAAIQLLHPLAPYPLRVGQCALLYSLCVTAACLMVGMMTSVLSAKLRTPFASVIIMMIILIIPMFLTVSDQTIWLYNLICLLPTNILDSRCITDSIQFEVLGLIFRPFVFQPLFALTASALFSILSYRTFAANYDSPPE